MLRGVAGMLGVERVLGQARTPNLLRICDALGWLVRGVGRVLEAWAIAGADRNVCVPY